LLGKIHIVTLAKFEKPVGHVKEFTFVKTLETALHKWEPIEFEMFKYFTFGRVRK
jgi:hypothetical protein